MNPQLVNHVRPGVIVSTILDRETQQAQTVTFRADKTTRVGFTTEVQYGPASDFTAQHALATIDA
jgi:hypothetical protein